MTDVPLYRLAQLSKTELFPLRQTKYWCDRPHQFHLSGEQKGILITKFGIVEGWMQYLAKVQKKAFLGGAELILLARQTSETTWELLPSEQVIETSSLLTFQEGNLVLIDLDATNQIQAVRDATPWVLGVVQDYLTFGVTPADLAQEIERAEQWRQSLTLKSQEVDRRALETAARRDEIQDLERNLKREQEELELRWAVLEATASGQEPPPTDKGTPANP